MKEGESSEIPGGAEGRRSRSRPWKADGRGVILASARELGLVPWGERIGWERSVEAEDLVRYGEIGSCVLSAIIELRISQVSIPFLQWYSDPHRTFRLYIQF